MPKHSTLMGGSITRRRLNCPASYRLTLRVEEGAPDEFDVASGAALRGTALHAAMEAGLDVAFGPNLDTPFKYVHDDGQTYTVGMDELENDLLVAVKAREAVIDRYFDPDGVSVETREVSVALPDHIAPDAFGTCDFLLYGGRTLLLVDYKFGYRQAKAKEQLMFYACGALDRVIDGVRIDPERVVLAVVQPAISPDAEVFEVSRAELDAFLSRVAVAVEDMQREDAEHRPVAGDWCQYAPCALVCPLKARAVSAVERLASVMSGVEVQPALPLVPEEQEVIETVSAVLERAEMLETLIEAAKAAAFRLIDAGFDVPGWTIKERQRPREWAAPDTSVIAALRRVSPQLGAKKIAPRALLSVTKVEKLAKALDVEIPPRLVRRGEPSRALARDGKPDKHLEQVAKLAADALQQKVERVTER
jgi:hypothetical protein